MEAVTVPRLQPLVLEVVVVWRGRGRPRLPVAGGHEVVGGVELPGVAVPHQQVLVLVVRGRGCLLPGRRRQLTVHHGLQEPEAGGREVVGRVLGRGRVHRPHQVGGEHHQPRAQGGGGVGRGGPQHHARLAVLRGPGVGVQADVFPVPGVPALVPGLQLGGGGGCHHAADAVFELGALMLGRGRRRLGLLTLDTRKFLEFFMQVRHFASFVTGLCSYSETKQTSLTHIK